jgi:ElaB/YqjD/DUF883 family membrane-anchored ribosome-binding protein
VDDQSPELIEKQMEETRESLTEKVSLLEQQVVGKIQSATDAVQDTVQSVRSAVQDTVDSVTGSVKDSVSSVSDGVKEALDVSKHVREQPWAMVGGAAAAGFIAGLLVFRRAPSAAGLPAHALMPPANYPPPAAALQRPGWMNDLFELAGREIRKIAEQALATTTASLKQSVEEGIPKLIDSALPNLGTRSSEVNAANGTTGYAGMRR